MTASASLRAARCEQLAQRIRRNAPDLLSVEPDRLMQATLTPNDPYLGNQWALAGPAQSNGAGRHQRISRPGISAAVSARSIAVIDTGYRPHTDLARAGRRAIRLHLRHDQQQRRQRPRQRRAGSGRLPRLRPVRRLGEQQQLARHARRRHDRRVDQQRARRGRRRLRRQAGDCARARCLRRLHLRYQRRDRLGFRRNRQRRAGQSVAGQRHQHEPRRTAIRARRRRNCRTRSPAHAAATPASSSRPAIPTPTPAIFRRRAAAA
jgi:hypothetical protein